MATNEATAETTHSHDHHEHSHDHEGHDHAGHEHTHGPALNPALTREIDVEAPADEVSKAFRTIVKRYQKQARIPGFRAGKVPESLVRSKFGRDLRQEVMESLVSERFRQALDEQKLRPISEPQLRELFLEDGQPLRFKAAFEVLPEFEVAGYEGIKVSKPESALTDDEFEAELRSALESHATVEPVEEDRALVNGDWAEIQFRGEIKPLTQTVGEEAPPAEEPLIGEDILIEIGGKNTLPAFNEALLGTKVGQELKFEVDYPADFGQQQLAGQTVDYDVTVKAIKKKTYPDQDDEIAKQISGQETWAHFENQLRVHTQQRKTENAELRVRNKMLDELVAKYDFPLPESFVQQQIDARLDRGLRALAQQGMPVEQMRGLDFERLRAQQRPDAEREVRASLVMDKIAEAEGVEVSEPELENELRIMSFQMREPLDALKERLAKEGGLNRMREQMRREKTGVVLYEKLAS